MSQLDRHDVYHSLRRRLGDRPHDVILAIRKDHMPAHLQHLFLPPDLILFRYRRYPDAFKMFEQLDGEPIPWTCCRSCVADCRLVNVIVTPLINFALPVYLLGDIIRMMPRITFTTVLFSQLLWALCKFILGYSNDFKCRHFLRRTLINNPDLFDRVYCLCRAYNPSCFIGFC
ncbi:hypothetical protein QBC38DRAFT_493419, partial [Podospora fimiseda]